MRRPSMLVALLYCPQYWYTVALHSSSTISGALDYCVQYECDCECRNATTEMHAYEADTA